jgi:hypothetical protein
VEMRGHQIPEVKRMHYFEHVDSFIFCVPISEYDQLPEEQEDNTKVRLFFCFLKNPFKLVFGPN